jgi:hypothetical protein
VADDNIHSPRTVTATEMSPMNLKTDGPSTREEKGRKKERKKKWKEGRKGRRKERTRAIIFSGDRPFPGGRALEGKPK